MCVSTVYVVVQLHRERASEIIILHVCSPCPPHPSLSVHLSFCQYYYTINIVIHTDTLNTYTFFSVHTYTRID